MRILFLCSGKNSCRSMIAKAIMETFDTNLEVFSAGVEPATKLNPVACELMKEMGIEVDTQKMMTANDYSGTDFDFVITVCEGTNEHFDKLPLKFKNKLHLGFVDPDKIDGGSELQASAYKNYIEEVKTELDYFYHRILKSKYLK